MQKFAHWHAFVKSVKERPGDYTAQDHYLAEVIEELLGEISKLSHEVERLSALRYSDWHK